MSLSKKTSANRRKSRYFSRLEEAREKAAGSASAWRDGLRARTAVLPGEDQAEFDLMFDEIRRSYPPRTVHERYLIEHAVTAQWQLIRLEKQEARAYAAEPDPRRHPTIFERSRRIQIRMQRAYTQAIAELEKIKIQRAAQEDDGPEYDDDVSWRQLPRYEISVEDAKSNSRNILFRAEFGQTVEEWSTSDPEWDADTKPPEPKE